VATIDFTIEPPNDSQGAYDTVSRL
jgi:hypothetical protein